MSRTSYTSEIESLAPNQVTTDPDVNTRPVDRAWVARKLREGFDVKRLGVPQVSARADGTYVWLDGQNRGALCGAAERGEIKIKVKVFRGLSKAEEAELFLGLNDNRRVQPIYKFIAEVTAGRSEALEITRIASAVGWKISDGGGISAVAALRAVYRLSPEPGVTLKSVLEIASEAWGRTAESVNAYVILGIAAVLTECPYLNRNVLVKKLAKFPGGPSSLVGKGKGFREATGSTVAQGIDQVIRQTYNAGRRGGKLPTWADRVPSQHAGQASMLVDD
ncbi:MULTISPECIES: DUF6551 family protein [unclassified Streptomyces]|uniref:DUF6551 family protein n=1 Tax=unclassified Streptomyces TaxID=2593676 RepID=UPI0037F28A8E